MKTGTDESSRDLPLHLVRQIDELCDAFERELRANRNLSISPYLDRIDPQGRQHLMTEVLALVMERLRSDGVSDPLPALLAANPSLGEEIKAAIANRADDGQTARYDGGGTQQATPIYTPRRRQTRGLRIRCPHCSNHVEVVGDAQLDSVNCSTCGSTFSLVDQAAETRMAETISKIDKFELVSRLGIGGFGTVWKARDTELDRTVAVKIPRHGQLTKAEMEQFFREARAVAQLRHDNIVPVYQVGREGDAVFIVSQLIRGVSLADMLTGRRPTAMESARMCATIARALDHAHSKGVIHRDLKPSNVMIDNDGAPHLMDFGLAKREAEEVTMTMEGQIIGTPAYMSPEQADGRSAWADRRTDIYSLGVIMFELLTGELPFRGNAQMQVKQRVADDAPQARTLNRLLPKDLSTICAKCLSREPGRRYQTAKEVAEELECFLDQRPIKARPLSPPERAVRWALRRPLQAVLATLVLLLSVVGPATALVFIRKERDLARLNSSLASSIKEANEEKVASIKHAEALQKRLALHEQRTTSWEFWPPDAKTSPKQILLTSLRKVRRDALRSASEGESRVAAAQRLLALATLDEAAGDDNAAEESLVGVTALLESLADDAPPSAARALADCYERLSELAGEERVEQSNQWQQKSLELRRELAADHESDPLLHGYRLESEMRASPPLPEGQLAEVRALADRLETLWPTDAAGIYRLACILSGRQPLLAEEGQTGGATSASGD